jgi:hypothetical protein
MLKARSNVNLTPRQRCKETPKKRSKVSKNSTCPPFLSNSWLTDRYVSKTKDRNLWIKKRDHLKAQQAALEAEMAAFVAKHEAELNALVQEYAAVRNSTGTSSSHWEVDADGTEEYMDTIAAKLDLDLDVRA